VLLFRGLLAQARATQQPEGQLAFQAVRDWLDRTKDAKGKAQLYRALVALEASAPQNAPRLRRTRSRALRPEATELLNYLRDTDPTSPSWSDVDRAFLVDFLVRTGTVERLSRVLESLTQEPERPQPAETSVPTPHEQALILYALSDALQTVESAQPAAGASVKAKVAELRRAALLRYYRAVQDQTELGGLWPDPVDSVLWLTAARQLETAGLFQGFRAQKKLEKGKEQDERAALPAVVESLPAAAIRAWSTDAASAKETALRRRLASRVWEANRYLAFSQELTRYLVDAEGNVRGDEPALAAGAFLSLWAGR
ncbi:MAG TPA: hypothetical protein GXX28_11270, partial [Firmicutes bacterium]|nr:hypothetical protein [Bacillota bacterium]